MLKITIYAEGAIGSGKTKAINLMLEALKESFVITDGRYNAYSPIQREGKWGHCEEQTLELTLK